MMLRVAIKPLALLLALTGLAFLDSLSSYLLGFGAAFCFTASAFLLHLLEE